MRAVLPLITALLLALPAMAQDTETPPVAEESPAPELLILDATETTLDEHLWASRPIVVFADTPRDPRFQDQLDLLLERPGPLIERDVVVIFDADPDANSEIRQALRPRGFSLVILQRDGRVALRKPTPWDVREITRAIDNLPMRIEEMGLSQ
ncbi:DUF4174 domain-containing protein [Nioella ostreopsis]|jgi:hypothetical protein|uniref:DUF4174 domain-containing protein n=1 Tax=Nioella ostreopsis TaxID=2448479 RepID=UPI000FDC7A3F|nr:DUF4174 domain-containing protein [Nioella ostreopsis]